MQNINELDLGKRTYTAYKTRVTESLRAFIETDDADVEQQALQRVDALVSEAAALSVSLIRSACVTPSACAVGGQKPTTSWSLCIKPSAANAAATSLE